MDHEELVQQMLENGWKQGTTPEGEVEFTRDDSRIWQEYHKTGVSASTRFWKFTSASFDGTLTGRTSKVITPEEMIKL